MILIEPGNRAYSWYQHEKANLEHERSSVAGKYSFLEVLQSTESNLEAYELKQVSFRL